MSDKETILIPSDDEILQVEKNGNEVDITDVGPKESEKIIDENGKEVPYNLGPM